MEFALEQRRENQKTKRHKESCNRDVGILHGWQDKKSKISLLGGIIMLLIYFKDIILTKLGLKQQAIQNN